MFALISRYHLLFKPPPSQEIKDRLQTVSQHSDKYFTLFLISFHTLYYIYSILVTVSLRYQSVLPSTTVLSMSWQTASPGPSTSTQTRIHSLCSSALRVWLSTPYPNDHKLHPPSAKLESNQNYRVTINQDLDKHVIKIRLTSHQLNIV